MTSSRQRRRRRRLLFHRFRNIKNCDASGTVFLQSIQVDDQEPVPVEAIITTEPGPLGLGATLHGLSRLRKRGITAREISALMNNPEVQAPSPVEGRKVLLGSTTSGRRLKLVVNQSGTVITASDRETED
jgi:hypothetical protein